MRTRALLAFLLAALVAAPVADAAPRKPCPRKAAKRCATKNRTVTDVRHGAAGAAGAWLRLPIARPGTGASAAVAPGTPAPGAAPGPAPAPAPAPAGSEAEPPPPPPPPAPEADPRRLSVRADEFSLTLSQPKVAAGDVLVEFSTYGAEDPHDLLILRADGSGRPSHFAEQGPGAATTASVRFAAGSYRLICTLPEHESRGMSATVVAE